MKSAKSLFLFLVLVSWSAPFIAGAKSDLDEIKQRVVIELMTPEVDDTEVESLIATIKDDGPGRKSITKMSLAPDLNIVFIRKI